MKFYNVKRIEDETGVSGTGIVAKTVSFDDRFSIIVWLKEGSKQGVGNVIVYASLEDAIKVHGHGGKTLFEEFTPDEDEKDYLVKNIIQASNMLDFIIKVW